MAVDYDGVIVGGTLQGREAAAIAVREGARVALVEPLGSVDGMLYRRLMVQRLARINQRASTERFWNDGSATRDGQDWPRLSAEVARAVEIAYPHLSLEGLAASGVDVVEGPGQFSPRPSLAFSTAERHLRARGFVLCPSTQVTVPAIPGLAETPYWTIDTLGKLSAQPEEIVILGRSPDAIALAQALALGGTRVTLVSRGDGLLPTEDPDISLLIESLLQAAGVRVWLSSQLEQVVYRSERFTLQFRNEPPRNEPLQTAHVLLDTARRPEIAGLNLKAIGLRPHAHSLPVDDRLNTAHPRIFACGPALGGYWGEATDSQDVAIAIRNALYLPQRTLTPLDRPSYLPTVPPFTRLGMTATQAQRAYGAEALVLQVPFGEAIAAHLNGDPTGICRWVVHRDGRLLGAQICGPQAQELMQTVALIKQSDLRISQLHRLPHLPYGYGEILNRLTETWQQQRWQPGTWRRDWAENWFNWRRSRPVPEVASPECR